MIALRAYSCGGIVAMLVLSVHGCDHDTDPTSQSVRDEAQHAGDREAPEWMERLVIRVERAQPSFDHNTEVFVTLLNKTRDPVVIDGLEAPGAAQLVHAGGAIANIHSISVGVKKPIQVKARERKSTSLLFEATAGKPEELRLFGQAFPVEQ